MDAVEDIKGRLSIEDVISEYLQLKRSGRNWKGLSPFGNEKTPSFIVSPEKQIWHDFSSGKGGNMFSFVMEMEGVDFKGALELLARKAGIDIDQYRSAPRARGLNKERLYELLELATKFYQVQFSKHKIALEYVLGKRDFSKQTALEWRLGYAPNTGGALADFAKTKGFSEAEVKQAGLSASRYRGGIQDMFRGRLVIPLHDPQGRVIGFTARLLVDDPSAPKYINTPQTVLYDKSRHIYGLHLAKEAIRKRQAAVLVEGNLDVIASHQAGVCQVVATAGTALTEPQLKALSRFTGDIRLSFDADRAGLNATERAISIASAAKVSLSIITLPGAKDPDELIRQDPKLWEQAVEKHQYALDWLMERYGQLLDITSAEGKRKFSDKLLPVVRTLTDAVERDHYLNAIATTIGVSREALEQKSQSIRDAQPAKSLKKPRQTPLLSDKQTTENVKTQDHFLAVVLMRPELRAELTIITPEMLYTDQGRQLLEVLRSDPGFSPPESKPDQPPTRALDTDPTPESLPPEPGGATPGGSVQYDGQSQSYDDYVKIQALLYEELYQGLELIELRYEVARLQARLVEQFVKRQKQILAPRFRQADESTARDLLTQAKHLDTLLNQTKRR